jgi:hypothetical protein
MLCSTFRLELTRQAALASLYPEALIREYGGRDRDRTCDPFHVKEVLFR